MTFQTTTIGTQTQTVDNAVFQITTVEQTISVFCDCCPNQASGARQTLQNRGWSLNGNSQFCPECNY